jgi:multidrug efflux pump
MYHSYDDCLRWVLRHQATVLTILILTICLNIYLFVIVPKGFFPQQDSGRIGGAIIGDQSSSWISTNAKMFQLCKIVQDDPAIETVMAYSGGSNITRAGMFAQLKPLSERNVSADELIDRLRGKLATIPGASVYLQVPQDVNVGGRGSNSQFQFTLQDDDLNELNHWSEILLNRLSKIPELQDPNSDAQSHGLEAKLVVDRDSASRLGVSMSAIDSTLNDAFGQRQVSNIYMGINQYHVVLEVDPKFLQNPQALKSIYVNSNASKMVPLSAVSHYQPSNTPITVNHTGIFPSITLSFNLAPGASLGTAVDDVLAAERELNMPDTVRGTFQGTAQAFQQSLSSEPYLILAALAAVYIVLGILYESYIHPITILSTLPSAGVGAVLALYYFNTDLSVIALIGIILLIGIVKKNAILMIDFAIQAERVDGKPPLEAIYQACLLRFRPIMMTTMAAMFGALPLALGGGTGAELRRPLGITIVGGLIVSQALTLFTTPVVYLYLDRLQTWLKPARARQPATSPSASD